MLESIRNRIAASTKVKTPSDARTVRLPLVEVEVRMPPTDRLLYHGVRAMLAALELIDWPMTALLATGHELADRHLKLAEEHSGHSSAGDRETDPPRGDRSS